MRGNSLRSQRQTLQIRCLDGYDLPGVLQNALDEQIGLSEANQPSAVK